LSKDKQFTNDAGAIFVGLGTRLLVQANGPNKTVELLLDLIEEVRMVRK
tara:strand:+ start:17462 stop:17608 length:147 start_codon:yes stop_codon:yes gene_type:complete